jgi:hypothetical protein
VPDTECEEWDTMKAWLKWHELDEWHRSNGNVHQGIMFCPDCPIELTGDDEQRGDGMYYGVLQDCNHAPRTSLRVPMRFISLEEITNDW